MVYVCTHSTTLCYLGPTPPFQFFEPAPRSKYFSSFLHIEHFQFSTHTSIHPTFPIRTFLVFYTYICNNNAYQNFLIYVLTHKINTMFLHIKIPKRTFLVFYTYKVFQFSAHICDILCVHTYTYIFLCFYTYIICKPSIYAVLQPFQ